jgi:hypothetical protein
MSTFNTKRELRSIVQANSRSHKRSIADPSPTFQSQRDLFLKTFLESKAPNWGGLTLKLWK